MGVAWMHIMLECFFFFSEYKRNIDCNICTGSLSIATIWGGDNCEGDNGLKFNILVGI